MKLLWQIVLLLALFPMAACTSRGDVDSAARRHGTSLPTTASTELAAVDSLLWRQPDSALAVLLPWFDTCGNAKSCVSTDTAYDQHYAHLLLAELLYKNYYDQTNRAELLQAVGYFDSLALISIGHTHALRRHCGLDPQSPCQYDNLVFLDARAHYINGVGYYEHDSVVPACKEYLKALEVMEEHFEEEELVGKKAKFMALTYTHLTTLFSDMYLHEQAIYFGKESLKYYEQYDAEEWYIAWMLNKIGSRYLLLDNYDAAYYYCNQGLLILHDTNSLTYRDIETYLAYLSYKKGGDATVYMNRMSILISKANSDKEIYSRCLSIGEFLYQEKQYDSAWNYFNKVYEGTQSVESKKLSAERLVEICKTQGKNEEALKYADFLVPFANQDENNGAIKSQLTEQYKNYGQRRQERVHQQEKMRSLRRTMIIVGSLLVLMLFITILYHKNKKRKQRLETQIEAERYAHEIQQAALAGRLKRSNANLKEQEKNQASTSTLSPLQRQNSAEKYMDEPICKHILAICNDKSNPIKSTVPVSAYANIVLSDIQKAQLKDAAMRHYGQLFEKLKHQHPELKEKDFFYCYLCLLGLDNVQIAALQQNSISTIWERENRLKRIFGSEDKVSIILNRFMNC